MAKASVKTNAMRILEREGISYRVHEYPHEEGKAVDGEKVAELLSQEPGTVFKTLVTRGQEGCYVFAVPVDKELDLKKAARAAGVKSVSMVPVKELFSLTGYVRGGCSPIGMKKTFPTYFDQSILGFGTVMVSGGKIGCQVELAPEDLLKASKAGTADLTL